MNSMILVLKTLLVWIYAISVAFSPAVGGGDFAPSKPVKSGNKSRYIQADAINTGVGIYTPKRQGGGRKGPFLQHAVVVDL